MIFTQLINIKLKFLTKNIKFLTKLNLLLIKFGKFKVK